MPKVNDKQIRLPVNRRKFKSVLEILDEGGRSLGHQFIAEAQRSQEFLSRRELPLHSAADRFDYETEMLILASRKGYRIELVPITTVYSHEVSSIHPMRDTIHFFKLIRRYQKR